MEKSCGMSERSRRANVRWTFERTNHEVGRQVEEEEKFLTTHHERDQETELDYRGARFYDADIGRFLSLDPLAVLFPDVNDYNYVLGNPIFFTDPSGKSPETTHDEEGQIIYNKDGSIKEKAFFSYYSMSAVNSFAEGAYGGKGQSGDPGLGSESLLYSSRLMAFIESDFRSQIGVNSVMGHASREYYIYQVAALKNRYTIDGVIDYKRGIAARTQIKAFVRARMSPYPYKLLLDKLYPNIPPTKSTPRFWLSNKLVNGGSRFMGFLGWASVGLDAYGVYNYYYHPDAAIVKDPGFAAIDAVATGIMYYGGPIGWGIGGGHFITRILHGDRPAHKAKRNWNNTCFIAGTKILMANGSEKNIEDIKPGDGILSVNMRNMEVELDVVKIIPQTNEQYLKVDIEFENGLSVSSSPHHPFFVKGKGWCVYDIGMAKEDITFSVAQLEEGDIVYQYQNGDLVELQIQHIINTGTIKKMYNIKYVKKNNTFFANGILVHNRFNN